MPALSSVVRGTGFYGRMIALMFQSFTGKHNPGQRPEYAIGRPTKCQARAGFYTSRGIGRGHHPRRFLYGVLQPGDGVLSYSEFCREFSAPCLRSRAWRPQVTLPASLALPVSNSAAGALANKWVKWVVFINPSSGYPGPLVSDAHERCRAGPFCCRESRAIAFGKLARHACPQNQGGDVDDSVLQHRH